MSSRRPLLLVVALLSVVLVAAGQVGSAAAPGQAELQLDKLMGGLKTNLKVLSQSLSGPGGGASALVAVREMELLTVAAKGLTPFAISELPEADQGEQLVGYQVQMARLLSELALLEVDVLQGHSEAALARVTGSLRSLRDNGHDRWQ